jgi:hypothetical protein
MSVLAKTRQLDRHSRRHLHRIAARVGTSLRRASRWSGGPIKDGAVVLVAGSETDQCLCSTGPKVEFGGCRNAVNGWGPLDAYI